MAPAAFFSRYSSRRRGVKPQFLETMIFCLPGNLYWERRRASRAVALSGRLLESINPCPRQIQRGLTGVTSADAHDDLANVDTGNRAVGLAPGTTHTGLQSIGTSARQHLVDTDDVEGVDADAEMETLLSGGLDEVLVGADTGGLESLGA